MPDLIPLIFLLLHTLLTPPKRTLILGGSLTLSSASPPLSYRVIPHAEEDVLVARVGLFDARQYPREDRGSHL